MWRSLFGTLLLEIKCPNIGQMLDKLTKWNITILETRLIDDLTVKLRVSRSDYRRLQFALRNIGCKITVTERKGIYWTLKATLRRPVLTIGILLYILFAFTIPGRVFFVQVEGNEVVETRQILEAAQQCGVGFGANRRQVRSEKVKNALLEKIPMLQWAGVNTRGCVAVISVRERQADIKENKSNFASIVASQDAIIRQITVLRGTQVCKVGQAVKKGEMLVSAYKDYGISLKLTGANAEIYGQTSRQVEAVSPVSTIKRTQETGRTLKYSLIIGKKQINFYKDSGISDTSCVKMYKKTYLVLPGGFVLPIALVTQEFIYYETVMSDNTDFAFMESYSDNYLQSHMISGSILWKDSEQILLEDKCRLLVSYGCYELIGIAKEEEFLKNNE